MIVLYWEGYNIQIFRNINKYFIKLIDEEKKRKRKKVKTGSNKRKKKKKKESEKGALKCIE